LESAELLQNAAGACVEHLPKRQYPEDKVFLMLDQLLSEHVELTLDPLDNSGCSILEKSRTWVLLKYC
jgi:hypothetical protein